ncbi:hypothetical protein CI665_020055 [Klebsiella quasipneumoniae subsp. similipneumoniae]|nr:hypothetical protein CI665_020055 [Klebsiella quasipneumoniae subsp. similipneumoniae]
MVLLRIVFPLNPCFVLWTSRSHKLPIGGKEEKILIYNQKELNKPVGILYALVAFYRRSHECRAVLFPSGERVRVRDRGNFPFTLRLRENGGSLPVNG